MHTLGACIVGACIVGANAFACMQRVHAFVHKIQSLINSKANIEKNKSCESRWNMFLNVVGPGDTNSINNPLQNKIEVSFLEKHSRMLILLGDLGVCKP